jgi:hypothetical protein
MAKFKFKRKQAKTANTFRRKEHKCTKKFSRKYQPRCYACHKVLQDLIDLRWHKDNDMVYSDQFVRLQERIQNNIIRIMGNGKVRYRHNKSDCEPGGPSYIANEELAKGFRDRHGIEGRTRGEEVKDGKNA